MKGSVSCEALLKIIAVPKYILFVRRNSIISVISTSFLSNDKTKTI